MRKTDGQPWSPKCRSGKVDFNNENPSACEAAGVTTPNGTAPAAVTVNINVRMWLSASHDTVESTKQTFAAKSAECAPFISSVIATAKELC